MFETEIQNILERKAETDKLLKQLHEIYAPYKYGSKNSKRDSIFYVEIRLDDEEKPEYLAKDYLRKILQNRELDNRLRGQKCETIEQLAELVKGTTINDFYMSAVQYLSHCYNPKEYEIGNMEYKENRVHYRKLELILNCLWLLKHEQPIDRELSQKIYKFAEKGETFIFLGCKVTNYKNGNLKIKFSDKELFNNFESRFKKALSEISKNKEE